MSDDEGSGDGAEGSGPGDLTRKEILAHALQIAHDYKNRNLTLTLRQLYYRFVALGLTGSGQKVYSRIGATLTDARYCGDFPIDWLEDRGRDVGIGEYTRTCYGPGDPAVLQLTYSLDDAERDARKIRDSLPGFLLRRAR